MSRPVIIALVTLSGLLLCFYLAQEYGLVKLAMDPSPLIIKAKENGFVGAIFIMGLMTFAVVFNPVPSAPIALASGAAFGHTWGTLYIVLGAQLGAMIAFFIARFAGKDLVMRIVGNRNFPAWIGSQNSMMLTVFVARLIPFISFDLSSYGAGLTTLKPWRFAVATLIGLLPASFLLAHFGSEVSIEGLNRSMGFVLLVGGLIILPVAIGAIIQRKRSNRNKI